MNKASEPLISLHRVSYRVNDAGAHLCVLNDVSLEVYQGNAVGVMGASGSGKSTLLNVMSGIDSPSSGQVYVQGKHLNKLNKNMARLFGFVQQHHYLLDELNALENVMLPGLIQGIGSRSHLRKHALGLMETLGVVDCVKRFPKMLSGGQKQRLAIARALIGEPLCLFADEPTGSLDQSNAKNVVDLLLRLQSQQGFALVMVTHDENFVMQMDCSYVLDKGTLTLRSF